MININIRMWANAQPDGRPAKHRWCPLFNAAKFGWCTLLECRAVTLPRRKTRWNLQCPKLANRSQPLVGRSLPYYQDMWKRYCCLTSFSDCRYLIQLRRYSPTKLCDAAQMAIFCAILRPVFPESRVQHISDLHSKFVLRPHHVYGRPNMRRLRLGEEEKEEKFALGPHHVCKYGRHPICDRWD